VVSDAIRGLVKATEAETSRNNRNKKATKVVNVNFILKG